MWASSNIKMKLIVSAFFLLTARSLDVDQIEETTIDLCNNGTEESCEAVNSTELSTLPPTVEVTSVISKKATTKKPKTTTAKSVSKKTSAANGTGRVEPQAECACDLTRGGCEVNCCCDVDCSEDQRAVFTRCIVLPSAVDLDHCVPPYLLYHNNTDHQTVLIEGGMLCVVRQNTHVTTDYRDVPAVKTLTILKKKLDKHKYYSWKHPQPMHPGFDPDIPYGEGSPVWISDNSTITYLAIPAMGVYSTHCLSSLPLNYLEDLDSSCTVYIRNKTECLASSYTNFTVVSSPRNFNFSGPQECTDDVCLSIRHFTCSKTCVEGKILPSSFIRSDHICLNVIKSVHYQIYHNGTQGIVEVRAYLTLGNFTIDEDLLVRKNYRITFKWAGSNSEKVLKRSGLPGYERGRPIISGRRTEKAVALNNSESEWLSFPVAGFSGHCMKRENFMFKENIKSECSVQVSGTCTKIQQQLWQHMLGSSGNLTEMVVSAFGDPRVEDVGAWVSLLTPDLPHLPALVTAVDIVMLYTLVGDVARPHTKIIGVYLQPLSSQTTCTSNFTEVKIQVSVKFVDKTVPPVTKFAPPPVYEIKLPQDFFYPFLSSGSRMCFWDKNVGVVVVWFAVCCLNLGFY